MTNNEGSENSSSNLQHGVDEVQKKPMIKYKRNPRLLCSSDIKDDVKSSENSNDDGDDQTISSTSSFVKAAEEKKPEIIPFKKRSSYMICQDDNLSPETQLPTREPGDKLSLSMSVGEEYCVEKKTVERNLVEGGISTKIHDGGHSKTTRITLQGGHDYNHIAPTVDDGKQVDDTKHDTGGVGSDCSPTDATIEKSDENDCHEQVHEVTMKDVVDESVFNSVPGDIGQDIGGRKPVGYFVSLMMDDGEVPDQLIELDDNGDSNNCLLTDHVTESKNGESGEVGDREGQQASMEDGGHGNNRNNTHGGEEQNEESKKPAESKNDANIEGSNNTPGREEKSGGKKLMEFHISVMIHDGGSSKISKMLEGCNAADGEQVHPTDLVIKRGGDSGKGKEIAIAPTLEGDHTPSVIANTSVSILAQGQQDPNTIICGRRQVQSTHEQGEVAEEGEDADDGLGQQASKKVKYGSNEIIGSRKALGSNGGISQDELQVQPPVQQPTRTIRLFGVDISCEQEHHVPIILRDGGQSGNNQATIGDGAAADGSRPMVQPRPAIRLFGVDIFSDHVQPAAMGDRDGGSSNNRLPGS